MCFFAFCVFQKMENKRNRSAVESAAADVRAFVPGASDIRLRSFWAHAGKYGLSERSEFPVFSGSFEPKKITDG